MLPAGRACLHSSSTLHALVACPVRVIFKEVREVWIATVSPRIWWACPLKWLVWVSSLDSNWPGKVVKCFCGCQSAWLAGIESWGFLDGSMMWASRHPTCSPWNIYVYSYICTWILAAAFFSSLRFRAFRWVSLLRVTGHAGGAGCSCLRQDANAAVVVVTVGSSSLPGRSQLESQKWRNGNLHIGIQSMSLEIGVRWWATCKLTD